VIARKLSTPPAPAAVQSVYQAEAVEMQPAATGYEVATAPSPPPTVATQARPAATLAANDLKSLLRSSSSVRAAIVLNEILGQPKGLQPLGVAPGLH